MRFFNTIVSRTTTFSIESFEKNKDDIISFFENNILFQLSVLIASRDLYDDLKKNKKEKVKASLKNYFKRAHYNPVPFGSFSKVGTLDWGVINMLQKSNASFITTKVDNHFFTKELIKALKTDWMKYTYYTNPTVHFLRRDKLSFYKTEVTLDGDFNKKYAELDFDENIDWIINQFENGAKIPKISRLLKKDGFRDDEIESYLFKIIEAGLIINANLFPPFNISKSLKSSNFSFQIAEGEIYNINSKELINSTINSIIDKQDKLFKKNNLKNINTVVGYDKIKGHVALDIQEKIKEYIYFTLAITVKNKPINKKLLEFGNTFYHHFNDEFIPLSQVFNPKSGLEYHSKKTIGFPELHHTIFKKMVTFNTKPIYLDVPKIDVSILSKSLPPTFGVIYELLKCKETGKEIVYFKSIQNESALSLLGRFTNVTESLCKEITEFEENIYKEQIVAEINMIPVPRALNIFAEKRYYKYEIPLNTVFDKNGNQIFFKDLYVKFNGERFVLISKKEQKEIIPRLTSAMNYMLDDSDTYQFLCDLQFQNKEILPVNFNLSSYKNIGINHVPRIYLKDNILLYPEQLLLINNNLDLKKFKTYLFDLINLYSFSREIYISDKKGQLIIDIDNKDDLLLLHKRILKTDLLYVTESIHSSFSPLMEKDGEHFAHELYSSVKNIDFIPPKSLSNIDINLKTDCQKTPLLSNWLYLELYCNSYGENEILSAIIESLLNDIELFFYVRYGYPKNHLRVRFKTKSIEAKSLIMKGIEELEKNRIILEYVIKPYHREIGRYGGERLMALSENLFHLDTLDTFSKILCYNDLDEEAILIQAILKVKYYFDFFNLTIEEMITQCVSSIDGFSKEFPLDKTLRKSFNKISQNILIKIDNQNYNQFLEYEPLKQEIKKSFKKNDLVKFKYILDVIHMSMNRLFNNQQRFNEFKTYYLTLRYIKQLKFTNAI